MVLAAPLRQSDPTVPAPAGGDLSLVDAFIARQQRLSVVDRFSEWHERHRNEGPALEARYRKLIPLTAPAPGEQYGFEVNLDACSGCKGCVTACHALNGLDDDEAWRSVGLLVRRKRTKWIELETPLPALQHVTTACHHCADPACLHGCPVLAYQKDSVTGIVRHLDDQCIGCSYCIMMCPYEVPRYSHRLGIVRKCDLCQGRLAANEAPACVQACPNEAISVRLVQREALAHAYRSSLHDPPLTPSPSPVGRERVAPAREPGEGDHARFMVPTRGSRIVVALQETTTGLGFRVRPATLPTDQANPFLSASPDPARTLPATRYVSTHVLGSGWVTPASEQSRLAPTHLPLVWMLVLTQLAAGLAIVVALKLPASPGLALARWLVVGSTLAGLGIAALHLGQPLKAWRGFLGWRRSWLSREFLAFGAFQAAGMGSAVSPGPVSASAAGLLGAIAVACSVMVYVATGRPAWSGPRTALRFAGTTVGLALATAAILTPVTAPVAAAASCVLLIKLLAEIAEAVRDGCRDALDPLAGRTRRILGPLRRAWTARLVVGFSAVGAGMAAAAASSPEVAVLAALLAVAGEGLERLLFFRAETSVRMPGP